MLTAQRAEPVTEHLQETGIAIEHGEPEALGLARSPRAGLGEGVTSLGRHGRHCNARQPPFTAAAPSDHNIFTRYERAEWVGRPRRPAASLFEGDRRHPHVMRSVTARRLAPLLAVLLAGCGSSTGSHSATATHPSKSPTSSRSSSAATTSAAAPAPPVADLAAAEHPGIAQFPPARGRTLRTLATLVSGSAQLGAATGTFTPGTQRLAFGLNTSSGAFIYAPTAIYIARGAGAPARGPYLAPADPTTVPIADRSQQNAGPGGLEAIYATELPIPTAGTYTVLALTRTSKGLLGAPGEIAVARSSPIPAVGRRPPDIATDTAATVGGKLSLLTTRTPPESMQSVSLRQVLGKRPVALLFSTPQFCVSRVCGPVTDVTVALQHEFGQRIAFIHQEVYANNQPSRGLRAQMKAFHLQTEPWLFAINRRGIIVARLEGAFGTTELAAALRKALR